MIHSLPYFHTHTHTHTHTYRHTHAHLHAPMHAHTNLHTHTHISLPLEVTLCLRGWAITDGDGQNTDEWTGKRKRRKSEWQRTRCLCVSLWKICSGSMSNDSMTFSLSLSLSFSSASFIFSCLPSFSNAQIKNVTGQSLSHRISHTVIWRSEGETAGVWSGGLRLLLWQGLTR